MRFGFWPSPWLPFNEMVELCTHAEATGWDGLWLADHFMSAGANADMPFPEAWITLAALAARVPRVRVGTMVTGNTYRHPAVLAKMAATLDHISGGRVVLGLGSGWQENEHRQYGIEFDTIPGRLRRLDEACQVIKALYTQKTSNFSGRYYQLTDATLEPKPVQDPLPLLIGGGGEKVTLKITAKYADEWNHWGNVAMMEYKGAILDAHCADVGRDPADIQRSAAVLMFMDTNKARLQERWKAHPDSRQPPGEPGRAIAGTPAEIRDIVAQYEAVGVNEIIVTDAAFGNYDEKIATMDLLMREVAGRA